MELWFLAVAAVLLVAAIVYSEIAQAKRVDALDQIAKSLRVDVDAVVDRVCKLIETKCDKTHQHGEYNQFNAHVGKEMDRIGKEFQVMHVRQRSLEKRIIGAERVVTVNIVPPIKAKGRGKSALINMENLI